MVSEEIIVFTQVRFAHRSFTAMANGERWLVTWRYHTRFRHNSLLMKRKRRLVSILCWTNGE